jgi:hypothetical protein
MSNAEKLKALKLTIDKIDKDYGKGSVMMMSDRADKTMEVISTGSIGLDAALGWWCAQRKNCRNLYQKVVVKQHWLHILLLKHRKKVACVHL